MNDELSSVRNFGLKPELKLAEHFIQERKLPVNNGVFRTGSRLEHKMSNISRWNKTRLIRDSSTAGWFPPTADSQVTNL